MVTPTIGVLIPENQNLFVSMNPFFVKQVVAIRLLRGGAMKTVGCQKNIACTVKILHAVANNVASHQIIAVGG
jgi:hypothetical protein